MSRLQAGLWSTYSRCYDGLLDLAPYRDLTRSAVEELDPQAGDTVVDLGCGTGNTLAEVLGRCPQTTVIGVDSSRDMLGVARRKLAGDARVRLVQDGILEWLRGAPTASVDRVVSVNVLYTMQPDQRRVFWKHAVRVLRPGGRMVVVTTDRAGVGPLIREHLRTVPVWRSLTPRLLSVLVINLAIWAMETRRVFDPAPLEVLIGEADAAGGTVVASRRCYGGDVDGVDVMLTVEPGSQRTAAKAEPVVDLAATDDDAGPEEDLDPGRAAEGGRSGG